MADLKNTRPSTSYLLQRAKSAAPIVHHKLNETVSSAKPQRRPMVVLQIDKNCPIHGLRDSTEALQRSNTYIQPQIFENYGRKNQLVSTKIQPFNNNPPLPCTQKDIIGNNLSFNSSSQANNRNHFDDEQLSSLMLYRDALKQNLTTPIRAGGGIPKMRCGRIGGHWRHIKQTNTYAGSNILFIDGSVRVDDSIKFPVYRFGYPPLSRQQSIPPSMSNYDSPSQTQSFTANSFDSMTWSATDQLNVRPSLSQYSNRYERHAKDGFSYWPADVTYQKPRLYSATVSHNPFDNRVNQERLGATKDGLA